MSTLDIPLDDIAAQARELKFWRSVATLIVGFFFAIGWVTAKAWLAVAFVITAVRVGFREGLKSPSSKP